MEDIAINILYVLNSALTVILPIYSVYWLSRHFKFGVVNPFTIAFAIGFPSYIIPAFISSFFMRDGGLFNPYYQMTVFVTNISLAVGIILMVCVMKLAPRLKMLKIERYGFLGNVSLKPKRVLFMSLAFFALFVLSFFLLANHSIGVMAWLQNPRRGYQLYREGAGHYYALAITFLSLSYVSVSLLLKKTLSFSLISVFFIVCIYVLGSKSLILALIVYFLTMLWLRKKKGFLSYAIIFALLGFGLTAYNFYSTAQRSGLQSVLLYFDQYLNSANYFRAYFDGKIELFNGQIFLSSFWSIVPRALYPDKPYAYGITLVNEYFWPGAAQATNTPAFAGPIALFADFGFPGVFLLSFFDIGAITKYMLYYMLYSNISFEAIVKDTRRFYVFLWLLAPSFLMFFVFPINLVFFAFIAVFINIANRIVYK